MEWGARATAYRPVGPIESLAGFGTLPRRIADGFYALIH
jgi:hypothetical protein